LPLPPAKVSGTSTPAELSDYQRGSYRDELL
jgi:hypothetical protein